MKGEDALSNRWESCGTWSKMGSAKMDQGFKMVIQKSMVDVTMTRERERERERMFFCGFCLSQSRNVVYRGWTVSQECGPFSKEVVTVSRGNFSGPTADP